MSTATPEAADGRSGPWRPGLPGLATPAVTYGFGRYGYGLFLPRFQAGFGGSTGALGAVTSLLIAVAPNTWFLVAGVTISRMSPGWVWTPYSDVVQDTVMPGARSHALSMISTGTTFGVVLAGPAALFAADSRWRWVWLGAAVAAFLVTAWTMRVLPAAPRASAQPREQIRWRELVLRPGARPLFGAAASSGLVGASYWSFAGVAVATANGGDQRAAPALWTVIGLAGTVGVLTGRFVRRHGLRPVFVAAQIVLAASTAILWLAPAGWEFALASPLLYGAGFMVGGTLLSVWSSTVFDDHPTRGFSVVVVFITLGAALGPATLGLVVDHAGLATAFAVVTLLALATLVALPRHTRRLPSLSTTATPAQENCDA
ncbi:MFS transporter [Amycolatopsis sp. NPDC051102]|uniref:MFS transporter n=1 Tax=Amycolatopsis sp. NPDC051102 TaxID=3155163 RepID=UPI003429C5E3